MNTFNELSLLFAVATPVVVLLAMNLFLLLEGERGTLMLPVGETPEGRATRDQCDSRPANEEAFRLTA